MEPLDPAKDEEDRRFSRRRISSILKAPRKSLRCPETPEQEYVVECAKPVEKRNSRRVSFAPANNVLLFSKDVKNGSPVRSPLQELMTSTSAATQNRVHVAVTEDGIQPILGMETLLNAPLHASQQRDTANFDTGYDFGEKTVVFSTDDAFLDMTQSHTINIDTGLVSDISFQNYNSLPARGQKRLTLTDGTIDVTPRHNVNIGSVSVLTSKNMDVGAQKGNISSAPILDPEFQKFLASLSKPSEPSIYPVITATTPVASSDRTKRSAAQVKTQTADVDKENQFVMEKSHSTSRKSGGLSHGRVICPEDEAQAGGIPGFTEDNDAFQCLFPTQEMYSQLENRPSHAEEETHHQPIVKSQASHNSKDVTSLRNRSLHDLSQRHMVSSMIKFAAGDECREKPARFTADDACPDGTRSPADFHLQSPPKVDFPPACGEKTVRFTASDAAMDVTRCHTVHIATDFELQSDQNMDYPPACGEKTVRFTASDAAMDMTRCHTVHIATDFESQSDQNMDFPPAGREQTVRFSSADAAMEMTRCLTVHLDHISASDALPHRDSGILSTHGNVNYPLLAEKADPQPGKRSMTAYAVDPGFRKSLCKTSGSGADPAVTGSIAPATPSPIKTVKSRSPDTVKEALSLVSAAVENSVNETMMGDDGSMEVTTCQTGCIWGETDEPRPRPSSPRQVSNEVLGASNADSAESPKPHHSLQWNESDSMHEPRHQTGSLSQKTENLRFAAAGDADSAPLQKSRRMSLADLQSKIKFAAGDECREKPARFTADDAWPDGTRSPADFHLQSPPKVDFPPACGEKTVRFTASDGAMDVTRCHTVHIATDFELQSDQNMDFPPAGREQTVRFSSADAAMEMTRCLTVHLDHISASDALPHRDSGILSTHGNVNYPLLAEKADPQPGKRSMTAYAVDPGFRKSLCKTSGSGADPAVTGSIAPATPSPIKTVKSRSPDTVKEAPSLVSAAVENSVNETMMGDDVSMEVTTCQTGCIWGETDEPRPRPSSPRQVSNEVLGASNADSAESPKPHHSLQWNESDSMHEPRHQTGSLSQKTENLRFAADGDADSAPLQKSRRMSLADLQSKVRRLSHIIHTAPVDFATDACTAPLLEHDLKTKDDTEHPPVEDPRLEVRSENEGESTQAPTLTEGEPPFIGTTPFNLKTKQLMSRLSVGSFKAKLPQRGKPEDPKKQSSAGEPTRTLAVNVTEKRSHYDLYDEEIVFCGDTSETLDMSLQGATEQGSAPHVFLMDELLVDDVFELGFSGSTPGKKRPFPEDETEEEDEKRAKTSTEASGAETSPVVQCDDYIADAPSMTGQSTDYSISSTRCEAAFESTLKQSMFGSQLEDYTNDVQRLQKLNDGTITVMEFFKLFNIDFIVNNPRQSNFPGRPLSDTDRTLMDILRDRHIFRPQQMVYEADVLSLTEKVEGLKERMWDLQKPLKIVNRPLWEEMRNSSEKELTFIGAKLKDQNNFFRRMSKVQSHEMKEGLYSKLLQANQEEQQRTRETIEEADEMLKSLDDCIEELENELTAIEENGFENKPSLKSLEEEMQKVTEALADKDRQISELELQKTQSYKELKRLKAETNKLESHVDVLHMVNEWKLAEKTDNSTTYTFLHETVLLELVYEESSGNDASNQSERKISHLRLKLQLDDEKSQGHARLVHKLLAGFVEGEGDWAETYPTSRHVPKLLLDVGLVVSRCRLLGEELRMLKLWGGMRLDILHISCSDTRVHIVFSCLKKCSQFEVIFSVSMVNHLYVLQVQSFKNVIGNATIQQIEEIVSSFSPAKNLLTKIVKRIHDDLLC